MEAAGSSETFITIYQAIRRRTPDSSKLQVLDVHRLPCACYLDLGRWGELLDKELWGRCVKGGACSADAEFRATLNDLFVKLMNISDTQITHGKIIIKHV
jgi:prolipoprotein diacylglyceryltransferase